MSKVRAHQVSSKPATLESTALKMFFRICDRWGLSVADQLILLGKPPRSTFFMWKNKGTGHLSVDVLDRISHIAGIYKSLRILLPNSDQANSWINRPNKAPLFNGATALDRLRSGSMADLFIVRQYLDANRGGWS